VASPDVAEAPGDLVSAALLTRSTIVAPSAPRCRAQGSGTRGRDASPSLLSTAGRAASAVASQTRRRAQLDKTPARTASARPAGRCRPPCSSPKSSMPVATVRQALVTDHKSASPSVVARSEFAGCPRRPIAGPGRPRRCILGPAWRATICVPRAGTLFSAPLTTDSGCGAV
jgi:hypothetical protein